MARGIFKNGVANLMGAIFPAAVSLLTVPFIVKSMGDAGYGVLVVVTAIVGYFAVLDLNITPGSIKFIAEYNALKKQHELNQVITFGAMIYLVIGSLGMIGAYLLAEPLAVHFFTIPDHLLTVTIASIKLAAIGFLLGQLQSYLHSIPQALQRYDISAKLETFFGSIVPLSTVALLWFGYGLYEIVLLRVLLSLFNVLVLVVVIKNLIPAFRIEKPSKGIATALASFSAYAYLGRIGGLIYAEGDKLVIGAIVGVAALTYYIVPFTLVNRIFSMSYRLVGVIYPVASALNSSNELDKLKSIYFTTARYVFYINACFLLIFITFAQDILYHWLGPAFVGPSSTVMALITLAVTMESTTIIPSLLNDGFGYPRVTGIFSLMRSLFGLLITLVLTKHYGIIGSAMAHVIAAGMIGVSFLVFVHRHTIPYRLAEVIRHVYLKTTVFIATLLYTVHIFRPKEVLGWLDMALLMALLATILLMYGYWFVLNQQHKQAVTQYVRLVRKAER